jgi:radical SAM family uncharacterized protein/radical SAM-linked protein
MPHVYADILDSVQKPVRYIGNEWNVIKKPWESVSKHVLLAFPDSYDIGMSHLGLRILYSYLNKRNDTAAERAFCPWLDMESKLRERNLPLVSMETQRPLRDFDVVGFSLQYELEYTNVLTMLDLGGIPLLSRDRNDNDPLIIGGGPCVYSAEPIADFFDCFLIGEGEEAFPIVIDKFCEMRAAGIPRHEILRQIAKLPGIYVPLLYKTAIDPTTGFEVVTGSLHDDVPFPIKRVYVDDLSKFPFPSDILVPHGEIVHDRVSIEIARGCTEGCRFCQAGTIYRPVRERNPKELVDTILKSLEETGYDSASLTSLSTADYSCISPLVKNLMEEMEKKNAAMSVSSMRVYGLTDTLAGEISKVRKTGFTMAPEAGSDRMREVINKGISEQEILTGARTAFSKGWSHIKMYFMIGLPTETEEDLRAIVDLAKKILDIGRKEFGKGATVTVSVSSLIPKPMTPFQWLGLEDMESLRAKQKLLLELIKPHKQIKFKWHDVKHTWLEGIFSRGDRRLGAAVLEAWKRGCRFDAWTDELRFGTWTQVFEDLNMTPLIDAWLKDIPLYAPLIWDHLDSLVTKDFQVRELKRALAGKFSPACEKPFKRFGEDRVDWGDPVKDKGRPYVCYACGLDCDLEAIKNERHEAWRNIHVAGISTLADEREKGGEGERERGGRGERANGGESVNRFDALNVAQLVELSKANPATAGEVTSVKYRCAYKKLGEFRYLSALDLTRTFTRVFARARIPLKYSQGFHPTPLISFGPALPVGMESAEEWMDFETIIKVPPDELLARLNKELPEDLQFITIREVDPRSPALFNLISAAEYSVSLDKPEIDEAVRPTLNGTSVDLSRAEMHARMVDNFLSQEKILITRVRKENEKQIDIRPLIKLAEVQNGSQPLSLRLILGAGSSGTLRPEEFLETLYKLPREHFRIRRERQMAEVKNCFVSPV